MRRSKLSMTVPGTGPTEVDVYSCNTLVVGAGAAGLRCLNALYELGVKDIALCVDHLGGGTSNNSGSDKQTYYKMGVFGRDPDSPMDFAETLFKGGMMHGDLAYIEGLGSVPAFFELCRLGVPFPFNGFGAYVGYKTDHDPRQRATSAGPKTSKFMFEVLLREVRTRDVPIFDGHQAVKLLLSVSKPGQGREVVGVVCLNKKRSHDSNFGITVFNARNVVLATGGPGELFEISVWPHGQTGSHGLALEVGAAANNMTEFQYGLASTQFRWNLSGTYQQVIPDYFSTAPDGISEKRHFLHDFFSDMESMASNIFLKGYQWPFHAERLQNGGSSLVDIAVHLEKQTGRRVFMDFLNNPTPADGMAPFSIDRLTEEARTYLVRSGATQPTPYERLQHMNPQSIDLYAEHGIDLHEPLEIAVCAQHCNGGLKGNVWWETTVPHLFAIGELNGTHGVRPGGSALNSGQVGAMRAAQYIANVYPESPLSDDEFISEASSTVEEIAAEYCRFLDNENGVPLLKIRSVIQKRMSEAAGFVRDPEVVKAALKDAKELYQRILDQGIWCTKPKQLCRATEDKQLALTSIAVLSALDYYIVNGGGSRGGYMILDTEGGRSVGTCNGSILPHREECLEKRQEILDVVLSLDPARVFDVNPVPVRPLPCDESWYETVWADWNTGKIYRL